METYTYQEEVEYEYKILNVLLKNKGFDTIARKNMNRKQTGRYDAYNLTYGNRPELFGEAHLHTVAAQQEALALAVRVEQAAVPAVVSDMIFQKKPCRMKSLQG